MGEYQISFTNKAWLDMESIADVHMQKAGPKSAEEITDSILNGIEQLSAHPFIGPLHTDPVLARYQYRKLVCGNYICIYRVDGNTVYIYRIVHGSTNYPKWIVG